MTTAIDSAKSAETPLEDIPVPEAHTAPKKARAKERTYLVIADGTEEFRAALHYALNLASLNKGHVSIAHIQDTNDFMHWGAVEDMVRKEMRTESEKILWHVAKECNQYNGHIPSLYCREGKAVPVITSILEEDPRIAALILGAATQGKKGQAALINHFAGKALGHLRTPVIIVPGGLEPDEVKTLI